MRSSKISWPWAIMALFALALGIVVSACTGVESAYSGSSTDGSSTSSNSASSSSSTLSLSISAPSDGAEVSVPFEVKLHSSVPLGDPETGRHHVHLYYDTTTPQGSYDLVYGDSFNVTNLSPGQHTILASLRNADHSDAGPAKLITVTVQGTAGGNDSSSSGSGSGEDRDDDSYDY